MKRVTIGQMADMNGVSRQTLRLYDEIGLLKPNLVGENGYRYYDISQCARLDMIQHMKSLGMELKSIKAQLDKKEPALLKSILERKRDDVDRQIQELKYQKRAIERTISAYDLYGHAPPDGTIILEYFKNRLMYSVDAGVNFYDYGLEEYEEILRTVKDNLNKHRLPQIYFSNAGTILRSEQFLKRQFHATEFFVFIDRDFVPPELITTLAGGMYLCIYCNRFEREKEYTMKLLDEIERKGYRVTGDCICEVIVDFPVFEESRRDMFFRVQAPIQF
ncbi:helix-turn-helix domain-containing protein [Christensenellaceae bacterium OttesenSCG-928-M15]|nr:helix-turn-helix domain-containing protein [Christensenellaceae bacterium OttesenSCG-928-M15]